MEFCILHAKEPVEFNRWEQLISSMPEGCRHLYYLPGYASIFADDTHEACAALYTDTTGSVFYPFILRPVVMQDKTAQVHGRTAREIAAPYGMGGPIDLSGGPVNPVRYTAFDAAFLEWCRAEGLASEFLCPHLYSGSLEAVRNNPAYTAVTRKNIVAVSLAGSISDIRAQCDKTRKRRLNNAARSGMDISCSCPPTPFEHQVLYAVYSETMRRQHAAARWLVPKVFFMRHAELLGSEHCAFYFAKKDGKLLAWALMIFDASTMYYHFAGSTEEGQRLGAPGALIFRAACDGQARGLQRLFLGGGSTDAPDDPVLFFKSTFSKQRLPFYIAWRVLNQDIYDALCAQKMSLEAATGYLPPDPEYFPLYRR